MLFVIAVALLTVTAFAGAALFRLPCTASIIAAYLLAFGEVVVITEVLSPFHAVRPRPFLVVEAALAVSVITCWAYRGRPRPWVPRVSLAVLRRHPLIAVLGSAIALALVFELAIGLSSVPNNWDSMTYHLSRAAAWYQHSAFGHVLSHTARQDAFPPNAEMLSLFTMMFAHTDRFVALPQFTSEVVLLVAVFGIARRLGFGRPDAAFASLLLATLSEVVLQATTTQNDLVVTACLAAAVYFLLGHGRVEISLAALALALALGTKLTAVFALPIVLLIVVIHLRRRAAAEFAIATIVAFAAVASPVYAMNVRDYGAVLGPSAARKDFEGKHSPTAAAGTFGQIFYRFIDFSGVQYRPPVRRDVGPFFLLNGRANEDISYFGPLGALLILPLALGYLIAWSRRRTATLKGALALALPVYAAGLAIAYAYNPFIGRFMLVPVGLGAALLATVYRVRGVREVAAGLGVLFLALALAHNEQKPIGLAGSTPIWSMNRPDAEALAQPRMATALEGIAAVVPPHARVGYVLGRDGWDYPLYGSRLGRRVIPLPSRDPFGTAKRLHLPWVVVGNLDAPGSAGWFGIRFQASGWTLLAPRSTPGAEQLVDYERSAQAQVQTARPGNSRGATNEWRRVG